MDVDYPDWKPSKVKLESELILYSDTEAGTPLTVSYLEASDCTPRGTCKEQNADFSERIELNSSPSLPSLFMPGLSVSGDVTVKIKEEPTEDLTPSPESSMENRHHFSPTLQGTTVFPEGLITVKVEDDLAEENNASKENRQHLDFTEGDPEIGVEGMQCRKMIFISCSEDKDFKSFDFPAFGADVAQKPGNQAENADLPTDESVFLHSEHFPRLSNCNLDSENDSVIDSPESSVSTDDAVKYKRKSTAQIFTESTPSEETSSGLCSAAFIPRSDSLSPDGTLSEEKPFSCKQCSARFKRKGDLRNHMVTHSNEKAFACNQCSARFKRKGDLRSHLVIHSHEKAFACNRCSAQFKRKCDLQSHLAVHFDAKVFVCNQCSAQFKRKYELKQHSFTHSDEKAFPCNQCPAQFKRKCNLIQHLFTHSNKKAFTCGQCSAQFRRKCEVKQHMLTHSNEQVFTCNQCSAQFKTTIQLGGHLLMHFNEGTSADNA